MSSINDSVLSKIDALQVRYIAALDARNMEDWLATFSNVPEASYIYTTAESVEADLPLALIMDDNHARLKDRVTYVTKVWVGTYADYRTRHFIQRTACRAVNDNEFAVETNFMVAYTPSETGRAELFATGIYYDCVTLNNEGATFLSKKAVTDTAVVERFMAYPL